LITEAIRGYPGRAQPARRTSSFAPLAPGSLSTGSPQLSMEIDQILYGEPAVIVLDSSFPHRVSQPRLSLLMPALAHAALTRLTVKS